MPKSTADIKRLDGAISDAGTVSKLYGTPEVGRQAFDNPFMRILVVSLLAGLVAAVQPVAVPAAVAATLRIAPGEHLTVVGSGFRPRTLVRVHVAGPGVDRVKRVRADAGGRLTAPFLLERCAVDEVTATAANGVRARVSPAWFVRECPPPPPLQPGTAVG